MPINQKYFEAVRNAGKSRTYRQYDAELKKFAKQFGYPAHVAFSFLSKIERHNDKRHFPGPEVLELIGDFGSFHGVTEPLMLPFNSKTTA